MEIFESKINYFVSHWLSIKWEEKQVIQEPRFFVESMKEYLLDIMRDIHPVNKTISITLLYQAYRKINSILMAGFYDKIPSYNMVDIASLNLELDYLCEIADSKLSEVQGRLSP